MKVILKDNIENLGKKGDIVTVAPGYARNYLVPKKLALEVTSSNLNMIEMVQKSLRKGLEKEMKVYQSLIERLNAVSLRFTRKAGDKDAIFGSVSVNDIRDALAEQNFEVEKKRILLDEPLKRLGTYTIPIKVFHEERAEISVEVAKEGAPSEEEAAAVQVEAESEILPAEPSAGEPEAESDAGPEPGPEPEPEPEPEVTADTPEEPPAEPPAEVPAEPAVEPPAETPSPDAEDAPAEDAPPAEDSERPDEE